MKIAIVTATSNSENYILSNINSINMQSYKNYEHIIIDNKSNDKTIDIIKKNGKNLIIKSEKDMGIVIDDSLKSDANIKSMLIKFKNTTPNKIKIFEVDD